MSNTVTKLGSIEACNSGTMGVCKKFLGFRNRDNRFGCIKLGMKSDDLDNANEVLAFLVGSKLGFDVAESSYEIFDGRKCIISLYNYELCKEKIVQLKSLIGAQDFHSKFSRKWVEATIGKEAWDKFIQMLMFDLIMHQTDRHINNIAFIGNTMYSLYDNGRSLFFNDIHGAIHSIDISSRSGIVNSFHTNEHGYSWMYLEDVVGYSEYKHLIPHNLEHSDFVQCLEVAYDHLNMAQSQIQWLATYMYRVYLIITRQENKRW